MLSCMTWCWGTPETGRTKEQGAEKKLHNSGTVWGHRSQGPGHPDGQSLHDGA